MTVVIVPETNPLSRANSNHGYCRQMIYGKTPSPPQELLPIAVIA
jgi:hypothetical protein